jgi:hypothetical protein
MIGVLSKVTYATWSPTDKGAACTLSNGNLTVTYGAASVRSTISKSSGKWYWEVTSTSAAGGSRGVGNASASLANYPGFDANAIEYDKNGQTYTSNIGTAYGASFTTSVIGHALDVDARTITWYKDGVSQGVKSLPTNLTTGAIFAMVGKGGTPNAVCTANFGASKFVYPVPAGFSPGLYK